MLKKDLKKRDINDEFMRVFKKLLKDFINEEEVKSLIPYVRDLDQAKSLQEKYNKIQVLIREVVKQSTKCDYLLHCGEVLLERFSAMNLVKRMQVKQKLKATEKMSFQLIEFERFVLFKAKEFGEQLKAENSVETNE